jgi:hypothetical protein
MCTRHSASLYDNYDAHPHKGANFFGFFPRKIEPYTREDRLQEFPAEDFRIFTGGDLGGDSTWLQDTQRAKPLAL